MFINGSRGDLSSEPSDKNKIDQIIKKYGEDYSEKSDNRIGFIDQYDFRSRDLKIKRYVDKIKGEDLELHKAYTKPSKISSVRIFDYGDIKELVKMDQEKQLLLRL
jgi:hypothetical protein